MHFFGRQCEQCAARNLHNGICCDVWQSTGRCQGHQESELQFSVAKRQGECVLLCRVTLVRGSHAVQLLKLSYNHWHHWQNQLWGKYTISHLSFVFQPSRKNRDNAWNGPGNNKLGKKKNATTLHHMWGKGGGGGTRGFLPFTDIWKPQIIWFNKGGNTDHSIIYLIAATIPSKSFIWVTSKYLGSCWSYRKTKATLLYQTTHSASNELSLKSLGETFVK